ncbi:MAG: hypothetical protein ABI868_10175 [Acidobacteriota bacterium]
MLLRIAPWFTEPDEEAGAPGRTSGAVTVARVVTRTTSLVLAFMVLQRIILRLCRPSEETASHASILIEGLRQNGSVAVAVIVGVAVLLVAVPRLRQGWTQFDGGARLRWFVGTIAAILAWAGSAYAFNAWYGQPHLADRAALIVLAGLVWWRPAFALPFAAAFWAIIWQFNYPALGFQTLEAEFRPVVNTLTLFSAAVLIRAVFGGRRMDGFLFLALCLVAANFWIPGAGKLRIGWVTHGHMDFLIPNAYTHGWLAFLEPQSIARAARAMAALDWPLRVGTLAVECGALLLFIDTRAAKGFLILFTLLLGMFFLTIGYLFWKWIVLQIALWILLFHPRDDAATAWRRHLFTRERFAVSLVVIGMAQVWFEPARLAWFDTPLASMLRYEAVGPSGAVYDLPPGFFAPYESHVAMARFVTALTPGPVLTDSYGVTGDRTIANALLGARSPEDVLRLEHAGSRGANGVELEFARRFDEFVRRTATASNRRLAAGPHRGRLLRLFSPLPFLWTFQRGAPYRGSEPIACVRVVRVSSFFDGRTYDLFRREMLRTIRVQDEMARPKQ